VVDSSTILQSKLFERLSSSQLSSSSPLPENDLVPVWVYSHSLYKSLYPSVSSVIRIALLVDSLSLKPRSVDDCSGICSCCKSLLPLLLSSSSSSYIALSYTQVYSLFRESQSNMGCFRSQQCRYQATSRLSRQRNSRRSNSTSWH